MRGCVRGYRAHQIAYSSQRLLTPLIRTGKRGSGDFKHASWDEALDYVAEKLGNITGAYGAPSVMQIGSSGACRGAVHHTGKLADRFLALLGGYTKPTGSYSSGAEQFVTPYIFGTTFSGMDAENLLNSRLIVLWGANIADTRFGCETESVILEARKRGAKVIVLDPRRTRTVQRMGDIWIPLFPGSDTALMAAVLYVLIDDNLVDYGFLKKYSAGFDRLEEYILGRSDGIRKDPVWAEPLCGVSAENIRSFSRSYGTAKPAALIPGLSIQRTIAGEEAYRMAAALQTATGNLGIAGGASGGNIWGRLPPPRFPAIGRARGSEGTRTSSVAVYRWPDAVLGGTSAGYPDDIRCLYVVGGNVLCTGSDVQKNIRAFEAAKLTVCHELFMTPTAAYCDVVLPVTSFLEREDVVFASGNYLLYSAKAKEPEGEAMNDYDIFAALAGRFGMEDTFTGGLTAEEWLDTFISESEIPDPRAFRRDGIYFRPESGRVAFSDFVNDPDAHPLSTPSGLVELASDRYAETGFTAYPTYRGFRPPPETPLYLISPHARYRINSQNTNIDWFARREKPVLAMNPQDAEIRGICDGESVRVFNEIGALHVPVCLTDDIMSGVVCLPAGAWPIFSGDDEDTGGCANILTSTDPTMPSESSRTHSVGVEVEKSSS